MRTTFVILVPLFVIALFASAQESNTSQQPRGVSVEAVTGNNGIIPAGREVTGKKYAVLVGVTEYQNMTNLRFTKNDAEAMGKQLLDIGFDKENVRTLTSGSGGMNEPTKPNIENAIRETLNRAKDGDLVVISLSGHGVEPPNLGPIFCPPETNLGNLQNTAVSINKIRDDLGNSNASFKLLIVDACREKPFENVVNRNAGVRTIPVSFPASNADIGFKGVMLESVDANEPLRNLTVFQSCSPGQFSWEHGELNHGIFTHFIVEGLRGRATNSRGDITMAGLLTYAETETAYYAEESIQRTQNPWRAGEGNDFILVSNRPVQQPVQRDIRRLTTLNLPKQPDELPPIPDGRRIDVATTKELLDAINPSNLKDGDVIVLKDGEYTLPSSLDIVDRLPLAPRREIPIFLYGDPQKPENVRIRMDRRDGRINITRNTPIYLIGLDISSSNGRGIQASGEVAEVGILFCRIHSCKSHGIYSNANIFIDSSVIADNGDGFQSSRSTFDVNNSRIENNRNYGITITRTSRGKLSDNILFDNNAGNWRVDGAVQN